MNVLTAVLVIFTVFLVVGATVLGVSYGSGSSKDFLKQNQGLIAAVLASTAMVSTAVNTLMTISRY